MKYRKKPVVIEAVKFVNTAECLETLQDELGMNPVRVDYKNERHPVLKIATLEGMMTAQIGDYIIKGVHGELYSCKPDIFKETYEVADDD